MKRINHRQLINQAMIAGIALIYGLSIAGCQRGFDVAAGRNAVSSVLDDWHLAAAETDAEKFFGSMTLDAVYLGTDASERWSREEFYQFAKPYFDDGEAWSFTPYNRNIHFNAEGTVGWFDELLETWMGVCRGSGVVLKEENNWKIAHYNLSIMVPNDVVDEFIELMGDQE
jgi:hypothetical protein